MSAASYFDGRGPNRGARGGAACGATVRRLRSREERFPPGPVQRPHCRRCWRPVTVCWCAGLPSLETRTRVVILQHPRERHTSIGTARMASLCLRGARLHVGLRWEASPELAEATSDASHPAVLLWPGDGARDVIADPPEGPVTLIVVDGTWPQARRVVRDNPSLAALPRYAFRPAAPSNYRIRKEPSPECVSTIEALAQVLGALEGDAERFRAMLTPFRTMVDRHLERMEEQVRAGLGGPRFHAGAAPPGPRAG